MTAPRPRVSEHTDAARLEALRDSMRPRVEGEARLAEIVEQGDWLLPDGRVEQIRDRMVMDSTVGEASAFPLSMVSDLYRETLYQAATVRSFARDLLDARKELEQLKQDLDSRRVHCAYCGEDIIDIRNSASSSAVQEHIVACPKHPIKVLEAQVAALADVAEQYSQTVDALFEENQRLTAEVERLRGVAERAIDDLKVGAMRLERPSPMDGRYENPHRVGADLDERADALRAALSLPTPAPEATE